MLSTATPVYFQQPFANNAGSGYTRAIPNTTVDTTAASLNLGFPPATFVDVALGGTPPNGMDFNGILNEITANLQWIQAGGVAVYNSTFSADIGGYPSGAVLKMASGKGYWQSTADNNTSDPDTSGANWTPIAIAPGAYLDLSVAGAVDVTLTSLESANAVIDLTGALTGSINVIVPTATGAWTFVNSTTGTFTITVKTSAGTGILVPQGTSMLVYCDGTNVYNATSSALTQTAADARYTPATFDVSFSVASSALTATLASGQTVTTSHNGSNTQTTITAALSITLPTAASLGFTTGQQGTIGIFYSQANNSLAVANLAGAPAALLTDNYNGSPTVISTGSTSASTIYSASGTTVSNYKLVGFVQATWTSGTGWSITGSYAGASGASYALSGMNSLGFGQSYTDVTASRAFGTTYYNTTGRPIAVTLQMVATVIGSMQETIVINGNIVGSMMSYGATGSGNYGGGMFIVPPGSSYSVANTFNTTLIKWSELS